MNTVTAEAVIDAPLASIDPPNPHGPPQRPRLRPRPRRGHLRQPANPPASLWHYCPLDGAGCGRALKRPGPDECAAAIGAPTPEPQSSLKTDQPGKLTRRQAS